MIAEGPVGQSRQIPATQRHEGFAGRKLQIHVISDPAAKPHYLIREIHHRSDAMVGGLLSGLHLGGCHRPGCCVDQRDP